MLKYSQDISKKNNKISDLVFNLYWAHVNRLNRYKILLVETKKTSKPEETYEKHEKWLDENLKRIFEMENKAKKLNDKGIRDDLERMSIDEEFLGKWDRDET